MVLEGVIGFISCTKVLNIFRKSFSSFFTGFAFNPSDRTIQNWILRYGLYMLERPKVQSDDWIFIIDFKTQLGPQKCLIILGIRLSQLIDPNTGKKMRPVNHEDLEPLIIKPVHRSSGEIVCQALEEALAKTGSVLGVVRDGGSDLNSGIEKFREQHSNVISIYDTIHKLARFLGKILDGDISWKKISKEITQTKQTTKQSPTACLAPPKQREKSRLLNIDVLVEWLVEIQAFLQGAAIEEFDRHELSRKLGWVLDYPQVIAKYYEIIEIIQVARDHIRNEGMHRKAGSDFRKRVKEDLILTTKEARELVTQIISFFKEEGAKIPIGMTFLGSSECIESLIGKYKILEERGCATRSITRNILAIGALVGRCTQDSVREGMMLITTKKMKNWVAEKVGVSDLAKRRRVLLKQYRARQK